MKCDYRSSSNDKTSWPYLIAILNTVSPLSVRRLTLTTPWYNPEKLPLTLISLPLVRRRSFKLNRYLFGVAATFTSCPEWNSFEKVVQFWTSARQIVCLFEQRLSKACGRTLNMWIALAAHAQAICHGLQVILSYLSWLMISSISILKSTTLKSQLMELIYERFLLPRNVIWWPVRCELQSWMDHHLVMYNRLHCPINFNLAWQPGREKCNGKIQSTYCLDPRYTCIMKTSPYTCSEIQL